jgi:hypothetical protein
VSEFVAAGGDADHRKHRYSVAVPLLFPCLLLRERVYRAVAYKWLWHIWLSRGRCIVTALHAKIYSATRLACFWNLNFHISGRLQIEALKTEFWNLQEDDENCVEKSFIICPLHKMLLGWSNKSEYHWRGIWNSWMKNEMHAEFQSKSLKTGRNTYTSALCCLWEGRREFPTIYSHFWDFCFLYHSQKCHMICSLEENEAFKITHLIKRDKTHS